MNRYEIENKQNWIMFNLSPVCRREEMESNWGERMSMVMNARNITRKNIYILCYFVPPPPLFLNGIQSRFTVQYDYLYYVQEEEEELSSHADYDVLNNMTPPRVVC